MTDLNDHSVDDPHAHMNIPFHYRQLMTDLNDPLSVAELDQLLTEWHRTAYAAFLTATEYTHHTADHYSTGGIS